jgi:hypothetical protein
MKPITILMIFAGVYIIGLFITKIVVTVHDNFASFEYRFDNPEIILMLWPMTMPLIIVYALFRKLNTAVKNIRDRISIELRNRKMR